MTCVSVQILIGLGGGEGRWTRLGGRCRDRVRMRTTTGSTPIISSRLRPMPDGYNISTPRILQFLLCRWCRWQFFICVLGVLLRSDPCIIFYVCCCLNLSAGVWFVQFKDGEGCAEECKWAGIGSFHSSAVFAVVELEEKRGRRAQPWIVGSALLWYGAVAGGSVSLFHCFLVPTYCDFLAQSSILFLRTRRQKMENMRKLFSGQVNNALIIYLF